MWVLAFRASASNCPTSLVMPHCGTFTRLNVVSIKTQLISGSVYPYVKVCKPRNRIFPPKVNIQHKSWVCFLGKGFSFPASSLMVIADKKPQNILGLVQISICDFECYSKLFESIN